MNLTLYMKSGNKIRLGDVKSYQVERENGAVVNLKVEHRWYARTERLAQIVLSQIEAITKS
jgi:hypothetical protein